MFTNKTYDRIAAWAAAVLLLTTPAVMSSKERWNNRAAVSFSQRSFIINGKPTLLFSGSVHYMRVPPSDWNNLFKMAKVHKWKSTLCIRFGQIHAKRTFLLQPGARSQLLADICNMVWARTRSGWNSPVGRVQGSESVSWPCCRQQSFRCTKNRTLHLVGTSRSTFAASTLCNESIPHWLWFWQRRILLRGNPAMDAKHWGRKWHCNQLLRI